VAAGGGWSLRSHTTRPTDARRIQHAGGRHFTAQENRRHDRSVHVRILRVGASKCAADLDRGAIRGGADFEQLEEVVTQHFQFVQAQSDPDGFVYICGTGNVNEGTRQRRLSRARRTEQISGPCRLDLLAPRRMGCGRAVCAAAVQRISISPLQGRDLRPVAPDCARRTVPDGVQLRHT
jgi:hypothetical protein